MEIEPPLAQTPNFSDDKDQPQYGSGWDIMLQPRYDYS